MPRHHYGLIFCRPPSQQIGGRAIIAAIPLSRLRLCIRIRLPFWAVRNQTLLHDKEEPKRHVVERPRLTWLTGRMSSRCLNASGNVPIAIFPEWPPQFAL